MATSAVQRSRPRRIGLFSASAASKIDFQGGLSGFMPDLERDKNRKGCLLKWTSSRVDSGFETQEFHWFSDIHGLGWRSNFMDGSCFEMTQPQGELKVRQNSLSGKGSAPNQLTFPRFSSRLNWIYKSLGLKLPASPFLFRLATSRNSRFLGGSVQGYSA